MLSFNRQIFICGYFPFPNLCVSAFSLFLSFVEIVIVFFSFSKVKKKLLSYYHIVCFCHIIDNMSRRFANFERSSEIHWRWCFLKITGLCDLEQRTKLPGILFLIYSLRGMWISQDQGPRFLNLPQDLGQLLLCGRISVKICWIGLLLKGKELVRQFRIFLFMNHPAAASLTI